MSYKELKIYQLARENSVAIHKMSLSLPKFELYETGSQIRRSSKSVRSNIVEGYGRRKYINEYIRFLTFSIASNDETLDHIETLYETGSLTDESTYTDLIDRTNILGKMLNNFIAAVSKTRNQKPATK
ncbi:four helix bundle protein [Fulvivirga sp. RKSG066]|uniref:four helix bundle protein n=1 Tax=Fulvivirga aurantia TaxID=2529383 RepID=UPI0012BC3A0E|nr:four helix bundle protein [Fulvivirga aurantia]MTI21066.1 four helix bundle protein [Fulvivirga aurantia]